MTNVVQIAISIWTMTRDVDGAPDQPGIYLNAVDLHPHLLRLSDSE